MDRGAWWAAVHVVAKSRTRLSDFTFTFHFHALEKEMATHPSVLAWRIPGTGEPGELPSMGSHRVVHDWSDLAVAAAWTVFRFSYWFIHACLISSDGFKALSCCRYFLLLSSYLCLLFNVSLIYVCTNSFLKHNLSFGFLCFEKLSSKKKKEKKSFLHPNIIHYLSLLSLNFIL